MWEIHLRYLTVGHKGKRTHNLMVHFTFIYKGKTLEAISLARVDFMK
jgi:hypothetical protein